MSTEYKVHLLINRVRKRHGSSYVRWSKQMAQLAHSQAKYCARVQHLVHSKRYAFKGGENLAEGGSNFSPKAIVSCWMHSKAGHREYLLSPRVTKAGIGIAKSRGKTYVAWAFSDEPVRNPLKLPSLSSFFRRVSSIPKLIIVGISASLIILGAHGLYVYFSRADLLLVLN